VSWKIEVQTSNTSAWSDIPTRFASRKAASDGVAQMLRSREAADLMIRGWRVVTSEDAVNIRTVLSFPDDNDLELT
jgi:hypothetical protein